MSFGFKILYMGKANHAQHYMAICPRSSGDPPVMSRDFLGMLLKSSLENVNIGRENSVVG